MAASILIKNAIIVNENSTFTGDVLIENELIKKIASSISIKDLTQVTVIDATGKYLIPVLSTIKYILESPV